jgi:hypothetical protein
MRRIVSLVSACLALAAAGATAVAATITHGPTLHDNGGPGYGNGATGSFLVPQFDDLGGTLTLTQVTLTVTINGTGGQHDFDNESAAGALITLGIGSTVRVKGPLGGTQLVVIPDAFATVTGWVDPDNDPGFADFAGTDYLSIIGGAVSDTESAFRTSPASLAPYIGTGDVTFAFDDGLTSTSGTGILPSPGANKVTFGTTNFSFTTTMAYDYVPEPATALLLALSAAAMGGRARKGLVCA